MQMTQKELMPLFSPTCYLKSGILLVSPSDFGKLEGRILSGNRLFMLVSRGKLSLDVMGRKYEIKAHAFLDVLDSVTLRIENFSSDLQAWGCFITFEFATESLKNLRPGPQGYLLERLNIPVQELSEKECNILEQQLRLLRECFGRHETLLSTRIDTTVFQKF